MREITSLIAVAVIVLLGNYGARRFYDWMHPDACTTQIHQLADAIDDGESILVPTPDPLLNVPTNDDPPLAELHHEIQTTLTATTAD